MSFPRIPYIANPHLVENSTLPFFANFQRTYPPLNKKYTSAYIMTAIAVCYWSHAGFGENYSECSCSISQELLIKEPSKEIYL